MSAALLAAPRHNWRGGAASPSGVLGRGQEEVQVRLEGGVAEVALATKPKLALPPAGTAPL